MRWNLFIVICTLILFLTLGCNNTGKSNELTLEIVKNLSQKGDQLDWEDFESYESKEIGSGLYIREYIIDDKYILRVGGGNLNEKPLYILLVKNATMENEEGIDIRDNEIDQFLD